MRFGAPALAEEAPDRRSRGLRQPGSQRSCLILSGTCAVTAPAVELDGLESWPGEDVNNILDAHGQLEPFLRGGLPVGWKEAMERALDNTYT